MAAGAGRQQELIIEVDPNPEITKCGMCGTSMMVSNIERCTVCGVVVCPRCDIRYKDLTKPTCHPHSG